MKKRNIYTILTLIWVTVIFSFSLQSGETSSQLSSGFGKWLIDIFLSDFIELFETMPQEQLDFWHLLLRKCGHFTEFFILGVLSILTLLQTEKSRKVLWSITFCALIASLDETIQLFVADRAGRVADVLIDCAGAMVGIEVLIGVRKRIQKKKGKTACQGISCI